MQSRSTPRASIGRTRRGARKVVSQQVFQPIRCSRVAGARQNSTHYPRTIGPPVRKSESPKVRKSESPKVRKSESPPVRKSESPPVRKSASPKVRQSAACPQSTNGRSDRTWRQEFIATPPCALQLHNCALLPAYIVTTARWQPSQFRHCPNINIVQYYELLLKAEQT